MTLTTVAQAIDTELDVPILAIRGKVTKLFPVKKGTKKDGSTWTMQIGEITDSTGSIAFALWDKELHMEFKGVTVEFRCKKSEKHGWKGIVRSSNEYQGKTIPQLKLSAMAEIIDFDAEVKAEDSGEANVTKPAPSHAPREDKPQPSSWEKQAAPQQAPAPKKDSVQEEAAKIQEATAKIVQIVNLQAACIMEVQHYLVPMLKAQDIELDVVQISNLTSGLIIQAERDNLHWKFPQTRYTEGK